LVKGNDYVALFFSIWAQILGSTATANTYVTTSERQPTDQEFRLKKKKNRM